MKRYQMPLVILFSIFLIPLMPFPEATSAVIEDFEHANTGLYTKTGGSLDNFSIIVEAAHDGSYGARFTSGLSPYWYYRTDIVTSPGNIYEAFVRFGGGEADGRAYIGVSASDSGAFSMVGASNTSEIILQDNSGYAFKDRACASFSWQSGTWYLIQLLWDSSGGMQIKLYDENKTTVLASTPIYSTGATTPGGLALRGFNYPFQAFVDIDTISVAGMVPVPEPGTMVLIGFGLVGLLGFRKKFEK